jgi:hypothetical protein
MLASDLDEIHWLEFVSEVGVLAWFAGRDVVLKCIKQGLLSIVWYVRCWKLLTGRL